jgi:hypothetical protein
VGFPGTWSTAFPGPSTITWFVPGERSKPVVFGVTPVRGSGRIRLSPRSSHIAGYTLETVLGLPAAVITRQRPLTTGWRCTAVRDGPRARRVHPHDDVEHPTTRRSRAGDPGSRAPRRRGDVEDARSRRYGGHAVRKNVAAQHGAGILTSSDPDPWRAATPSPTTSTNAAATSPLDGLRRCRQDRTACDAVPLSADRPRYERLKRDFALYRLTFGQPRQEDMLELLRGRPSVVADTERIDLRPAPIADEHHEGIGLASNTRRSVGNLSPRGLA